MFAKGVPYCTDAAGTHIPGTIIKQKAYRTFLHSSTLERFADSLDDIKGHVYVYLHDADQSEMDQCRTAWTGAYQRPVTFVNRLSDIKPQEDYSLVARKCGPLWSLVADYDLHGPRFANKGIYVDDKTYSAATVIMTEEELKILHKYLICPSPADQGPTYELTPKNTSEMTVYIKNVPLPGGRRNPVRAIEGLSGHCSGCSALMYLKYIQSDTCVKCQ